MKIGAVVFSRRVVVWAVGVVVCLVVAYVGVRLGTPVAAGVLRAAFSQEQHGSVRIARGDRHVVITLDRSFPSPPRVQVTPRTMDAARYAVRHVTTKDFRLELDRRANTDIDFFWSATFTRGDALALDMNESSVSTEFEVKVAGQTVPVLTTGVELFVPTEFWVDWRRGRGPALDLDQLKAAVLARAFDDYRSEHRCTPVDYLARALRLRVRTCPPHEVDPRLPGWSSYDLDEWKAVASDEGVRIVHQGQPKEIGVEELADKLSKLMKQTRAADLMEHHNQIIDFIDAVDEDRLPLAKPMTVVHFDSHSDLNVHKDPRAYLSSEHIGDFLNTLIARGQAAEVYWVMPDWTRHPAFASTMWDPHVDELENDRYTRGHYEEGPKRLDLYVDRTTGFIHMGKAPENHKNPLTHVVYHKVTLAELPSFAGNDKLFIEFDADFFSNTGYHTKLLGHDNPSRSKLTQIINKVFDRLAEQGASPELVGICASPSFATVEDYAVLEQVFAGGMRKAGLKDYLIGYPHLVHTGTDWQAHRVKRETRLDLLSLELILAEDAGQGADGQIRIDEAEPEYRAARDLVQRTYGVDAYDADTILMRLDRFDGALNGTLVLDDIEYYAALDDLAWVEEQPGKRPAPERRARSAPPPAEPPAAPPSEGMLVALKPPRAASVPMPSPGGNGL